MAEIVISEFMDAASVEELRRDFDVKYDPDLVDRPDDLAAELAAGAKALIVRNRTQVTDILLSQASKLIAIGRLGVGLDNIDLESCSARAIKVFPATGANAQAVAEYTITAIFILLRNAYHSQQAMLAGEWPREQLAGREITGKTLAIVGLGSIGSEVARRALALGMNVAAYDPYVDLEDLRWRGISRYNSLEALLPVADVLSLHVPLTAETRNLIGNAALKLLPAGALLINTARGGILDDNALAISVREGRIAGAALDVFEQEPLTVQGASRFDGLQNVILTPHIAGLTIESNQRVSSLTGRNVRNALLGTI